MKCLLKAARISLGLGAVMLAACGKSGAPVTADWHFTGSEAKQIALQTHRPLFVAFMGSDWSEPCQTIRKNVLDTQAFKDFADANLVLVMADFPRDSQLTPEQTRQNAEMAKGGQVDRLPVFMLVDPRNNMAFSRIANFSGSTGTFIAQIQAGLDQYQMAQQSSSQPSSTAPSQPGQPPVSTSGPSFSQLAPTTPVASPVLPAFPGSLPTPEELMRRQQQAPPSP